MENNHHKINIFVLKEFWDKLGRDHEIVNLYGVGDFTQWFLERIALSTLEGPEIKMIIDDTPEMSGRGKILDIPVVFSPKSLEKGQAILISCIDDNRFEMGKRVQEMYPDSSVINLFPEIKQGTISIEDQGGYPFIFTPEIDEPYDTRDSLEEQMKHPLVMMEISSYCNFSCKYCFTPQKKKLARHMDMDVFSKIVQQLPELNPKFVAFGLGGEPVLNPNHLDMIRMITKQDVEMRFFTNGMILKKEHLKEKILHVITISLRAEDFSIRSPNTEFTKYYQNIIEFIKAWNESSSSQSNLAILVLYTPQGLPETVSWEEKQRQIAPNVRKFLIDTGLRNTFIDPLNHRFAFYKKKNGQQLAIKVMPVMYSGFYPERDKSVLPVTTSTGFCNGPWRIISVTADGNIGCCNEISKLGVYMNSKDQLLREPLKQIWLHHPRLIKLREKFLLNHAVGACQRCLGGNENNKKIWTDYDVTWFPDAFPDSIINTYK